MFERLEVYLAKHSVSIHKNSTNGDTVDAEINGHAVQLKYTSSCTGLTYSVHTVKSAGKFEGKRLQTPYSENEPFEFLVGETGPENHGRFCFIPKASLLQQGILTIGQTIGKIAARVAAPDRQGTHWTTPFWDNVDPFKTVARNPIFFPPI